MQWSKYKNQHIAIFGLGKTGLSIISALMMESSVRIYVWDDNEEKITNIKMIYPKCIFIHPKEYNWDKIKVLILSPGVPILHPVTHWIVKLARSYGCKIKSDIELFFESRIARKQKLIGITGTNGKSTTVSLIGHILRSTGKKFVIGGNLGIPVFDLEKNVEIYVIEFSSFQLELLNNIKIDIAVLLNITPDHIDRHGSMENYIATKLKLINNSDIAVIGCSNAITLNIFNKFTGKKIPISASMLPFVLSQNCNIFKPDYINYNTKINLISNAENIVAAYAVCKLLKIEDNIIIDGVRSFSGLKHRNEPLGRIKNIFFVNDSKATNAKSSEKAILSYKNIYWIVGGRSKEGGIESLNSEYFTKIKKAFLIGESTEAFADIMKKNKVNFIKSYNLKNAFKLACKCAISSKEEITILFSPACSSFDQWRNFEERGEVFCRMFDNLSTTAIKSVAF